MSIKEARLKDLDESAFAARYGCDRFAATVLSNRYTYILEHICGRLLACAFSPILRDFYDFAEDFRVRNR